MPIYVLRPVKKKDVDEDGWEPWSPWYDKAFGFVIQADNEEQARQIAQENAGDETNKSPVHHNVPRERGIQVWTNPEYATCETIEEYTERTDEAVIIKDFHAA